MGTWHPLNTQGWDTAGQGGAGDRQSPFHALLTAQGRLPTPRPCPQSHADRSDGHH